MYAFTLTNTIRMARQPYVVFALCAAVLLVQAPAVLANANNADGLIGKGKLGTLVGKGKAATVVAAITPVAIGKGKGKGADFPPAPTDWAAGQCTG